MKEQKEEVLKIEDIKDVETLQGLAKTYRKRQIIETIGCAVSAVVCLASAIWGFNIPETDVINSNYAISGYGIGLASTIVCGLVANDNRIQKKKVNQRIMTLTKN